MLTNCCPASPTLPTIPAEHCARNFGQIQKIIFQHIWQRDGVKNYVVESHYGVLAFWASLKVSTGNDKIAVTPFIESPSDDGGDARTYGGGNDTLNGIEIVIGSNPVNFTCRLNGKEQSIIAELKKLMCDAHNGDTLGVYLINENGQIEGIIDETPSGEQDPFAIYPIPIQRLFVGDKHHGNFDGPDYNELSFSFTPVYIRFLETITLDASALVL